MRGFRSRGREREERSLGLGRGEGTYSSVVDEAGGWRAIVWEVGIVIIIVIIIPMIWVLRWTKFRGWDLDVKGGKGLAETGEGGDRAGVGLKSYGSLKS